MKIDIRLEGTERTARKLAKGFEAVHRAVARELKAGGVKVEASAKRRASVDQGRLRNSISHEILAGGLAVKVGTNLEYARAIEHGLPPGTRPPVEALEGWARRVLGIADPAEARAAAWAIAKKIERHGTHPQPFLYPAYEAERTGIQRRVRKAARDAWREAEKVR